LPQANEYLNVLAPFVLAQDLPVVVIVVTPGVAGGDEVLFLYPSVESAVARKT
jgi:hypothetical protein